jgi:hypothetical protein
LAIPHALRYFKRLSSSGSGNKWVLHFDHLVFLAKSMIRKCICNNLNKNFALICTFLISLMIQYLKKTSHFGMIIFRRNFWAKGWSVVGIYSQNIEDSSFSLVVVSGWTTLGMVHHWWEMSIWKWPFFKSKSRY